LIKYIEFSGITQDFEGLMELLVKEQYLATCSKELEIFLRERSLNKLDELAKHAEQFLTAYKYKGSYKSRDTRYEKRNEHRENKRDSKTEETSPTKPIVNTDGKRRCWLCNSTRHVAKDYEQRNSRNANKAMAMRTEGEGTGSEDEEAMHFEEEIAAMDMRDLRLVRSMSIVSQLTQVPIRRNLANGSDQ